MAARVQLPLLDRELVDLFMGTLKGPYFQHDISSTSALFFDMVIIVERVKMCIKAGSVQVVPGNGVGISNAGGSGKKPYFGGAKKKEGDSSYVFAAKGKAPVVQFPYHPNPVYVAGAFQPWVAPQ